MNGGFRAHDVLRETSAATGLMGAQSGASVYSHHASASDFPHPADPNHRGSSTIGLVLAMSSSVAIGASFILKKRGLRRAAMRGGPRAGNGGYGYLKEPLWWSGMVTMIVGEAANFAAYAFAPAILVTPLGALSIIVAAVLSNYLLDERLNPFGWLGCVLCVVGSLIVVLHAPEERVVSGMAELKALASQTGFLCYAGFAVGVSAFMAVKVAPAHGDKYLAVPLGICSLVGSLSVMSCKALGIAMKLSLQGNDQVRDPDTWACALIVCACVVTQMNYLNKALDVFNAAVVTPVYYVGFTTCTLTASSVMFEDHRRQTYVEIVSQLCGFATILCGVFVLHVTKDPERGGLGLPGSAGRMRESFLSKTRYPRFQEAIGTNAGTDRDESPSRREGRTLLGSGSSGGVHR